MHDTREFLDILGVFAKLRKATIRFVICLSVRQSSRNNAAPTVHNLMKFDI